MDILSYLKLLAIIHLKLIDLLFIFSYKYIRDSYAGLCTGIMRIFVTWIRVKKKPLIKNMILSFNFISICNIKIKFTKR